MLEKIKQNNQNYSLKSKTIERAFGDAKEKYEMRYTMFRGLEQVTKWVKLKFACMNLKKLLKSIQCYFTHCFYEDNLNNLIVLSFHRKA